MKKKYFIPSLIAGALVLAAILFSCSNLIEELRGRPMPAATYTVTVATGITHGTVSSDKTSAQKDETVTLTVAANNLYVLDTLSVKDTDNNDIATTKLTAVTYTFVMPEGNVTVSVTFEDVLAMVDVARNTVTITGKTNTDNYAGVFTNGRNVTLSPYKMCKYEITQGVYAQYMEGESINGKPLALNPSYCQETGTYPLVSGDTQNLRPVEGVTWYDAVYFCNILTEKTLGADKKVYTITNSSVDSNGHITSATVTMDMTKTGYRLPTEAEWEFAARGGDTTAADWDYTFSGHAKTDGTSHTDQKNSGMDSVGWYRYNTGNGGVTGDSEPTSNTQGWGTHQIGGKSQNRLGIYDMSGNVWEWCWDWYNSSVGTGDVTDPVGASSGSVRVVRGGTWYNYAYYCSVEGRDNIYPGSRGYGLGFRLVRSAN